MARRWSDLTEAQRKTFVAMGVAQMALAGAAWTDLALRPRTWIWGQVLGRSSDLMRMAFLKSVI